MQKNYTGKYFYVSSAMSGNRKTMGTKNRYNPPGHIYISIRDRIEIIQI